MKTSTSSSVLSFLVVAACHRGEPAEPPPSPAAERGTVVIPTDGPQSTALTVSIAEPCPGLPLQLNGRLVWDEDLTARVFTPFSGRVANLLAPLGQPVAAGAPLMTMTSPEFGEAQADARRAAADLELAERTAARLRELLGHGAVAQKELLAAEAELVRARADRERTSLRLACYGGSADTIDQTFVVKAPIDGVVVDRNACPGQELRADQMLANVPQYAAPLFVLSDPRRLWVLIDAGEAELPLLRPGTPLSVHTPGDPAHRVAGKVELVADAVDPVTRMVRVRGSVENQDRLLKAEMFVCIDVAGQEARGTQIAATGVFLAGEREYSFVQTAPGRFVRREVRVGSRHEGTVQVLEGLQAGEHVVTGGCMLLEQIFQGQG